MDDELSVGAMIAVEIAVLSAVIGIIMLFAGIGQQYQRSTLESINNVVAASYGSELEEMCEGEGSLPASTVYLIMESNSDIIESVTGYLVKKYGDGTVKYFNITDKENLKDFFDVRVKTSVTRNSNDMYVVDIEPDS
jgi:hypothetical protein